MLRSSTAWQVYSVLKSEQKECIEAVYIWGRDVFLCLPIGFSKSICYQVLPFRSQEKFDRQWQWFKEKLCDSGVPSHCSDSGPGSLLQKVPCCISVLWYLLETGSVIFLSFLSH